MRKLLAAFVMVLALSCVFGTSSEAEADTMVASYYGPGFEGNITASGDVFEPYAEYTCAHRTLPFGTYLLVIYQGESVVCEVTDRWAYSG